MKSHGILLHEIHFSQFDYPDFENFRGSMPPQTPVNGLGLTIQSNLSP